MTEPAEGTTFTPNLNLAKQPEGAENWGEVLNENFDKIDEAANKGGGGLEIGDIGFAPLGVDETQNKRRYLNGQVISQSQFATFTAKVKEAVALYPSLSATEANWQAEVTNSKLGQCGKFVIDDTAGTIRLPKVVNINGLQNLANLGGIKAESLPNIKGSLTNGGIGFKSAQLSTNGCIVVGSSLSSTVSTASATAYNVSIDASLVSSTYQDGAKVQQEAIQYPYFIQVATGSEESVDVSTEIQLNNPFFFGMHIWSDTAISNASWLISNGSYHSGATYVDFYQWLLQKRNEKSKQLFGFKKDNILCWTDTETPQVNDLVYGYGYNSRVIFGYVSAVDASSITVINTYTSSPIPGCVRYPSADNFNYIIDKDGINVVTNVDIAANYPPGYNHNFDYDYVINTADTTFRLPVKVKLASGNRVAGNGMTLGFDTGVTGYEHVGIKAGDGYQSTAFVTAIDAYGKNVGNTAGNGIATGKVAGITTDPTKSGIETSSQGLYLYFYVGETIQDANVINAAGVLTKVANGIDRTVASDRETVVGWGMPDFSAGVDIPNDVYTKLPVDAFVSMKGAISGDYTYGLNISLNGEDTLFEIYTESIYGTGVAEYLPKGMYVKPMNANKYARYYPLKGAN